MQGVSINIFIKTGNKKKNELAKVLHYDLYGKRESKYDFLYQNSLTSIAWTKLHLTEPSYLLANRNNDVDLVYRNGLVLSELFTKNSSGIETGRDTFFYAFSQKELKDKIENAFENKDEAIKKFEIGNTSGFSLKDKFLSAKYNSGKFNKVICRPFDVIHSYYDEKIQRRPAFGIMQNMFSENVGLIGKRGRLLGSNNFFAHIFISKNLIDKNFLADQSYISPLSLYPETNGQQTIGKTAERTPNLNTEIVKQIAEKLGLTFTYEKETTKDTFAPIDILDYIYAVLHSPTYREKYKEFLKIDFPRVPYPKDKDTFWQLVKLGGEIRQIHILESTTVEKYITQYPEDGNNVVVKTKYENGKVYINDTQYFDNVPQVAWDFYIGGYQPAQKWLKDRKERKLEFDDILHYQKIIVALTETNRLMNEINKIDIE